jgi:predicted negative regulator of RcsB-dependent stress response
VIVETIILASSILISTILILWYVWNKRQSKGSQEAPTTPQGYERFLEDSRTMAFQYIEEAQAGIYQAIEDLESISVTKKEFKKIEKIIDNLKNLVPPKQ